MAAQFGRKAVGGAGAAAGPASSPAPPMSDIEAKRAAFLAAERARRESEGGSGGEAAPVYHAERLASTAYIFWFFLGAFAAHRFYLGYHGTAAAQVLLRFGGLAMFLSAELPRDGATLIAASVMMLASGIWLLVDLMLIQSLCAAANRRGRAAAAPAPAGRYHYA